MPSVVGMCKRPRLQSAGLTVLPGAHLLHTAAQTAPPPLQVGGARGFKHVRAPLLQRVQIRRQAVHASKHNDTAAHHPVAAVPWLPQLSPPAAVNGGKGCQQACASGVGTTLRPGLAFLPLIRIADGVFKTDFTCVT